MERELGHPLLWRAGDREGEKVKMVSVAVFVMAPFLIYMKKRGRPSKRESRRRAQPLVPLLP